MSQQADYTNIDRPYDSLLSRDSQDISNVSSKSVGAQGASTTSSTPPSGGNQGGSLSNGNVETMPVKSDGAMGDLWIKNFIRSENWKPKSVGFYIDGKTGYAEFSNVFVSGEVQASLGLIGGFEIGSDYLRDSADSFGLSSTATAGNDVRLWAGATFANRGIAPFRVYEDGTITGTGITVSKINIPDETTVESFHVDVSGNTWWGANVATGLAGAPASVTNAGVLTATGVNISGSITATSGSIGSFTIGSYLYTGSKTSYNDGNPGIHIGGDGIGIGNNVFTVSAGGVITAISGTIGGCVLAPTSIGSTTFVSGPLGSGWNISNTGTAEFQNVIIRGTIRTSVFEKDTISAVNGIMLVSKADVLSADMTALDASTITISGQTTFVVNEVLRIKDGTDDEWMLVTNVASAPTYIVTRDLAGTYPANTNPAWKKGTAVVSMGVGTGTKTGFVLLDSSSANSPYIDVYGRNSNTYSDYTLHGRFGWLQGITDADVGLATTDVWGLYTDNAYIKGVVVANTGKIGGTSGWTIAAGSISSVNGGNTTTMASGGTNAYIAGTTGSPQFIVTHAGALTATSATITGSVTATSGTIGGWTIGATSLSAVSGGNTTTLSSGATSFSSGPTGSPTVTITQVGVLSCTGAIIDGTSTLGGRTGSIIASAIDSSGHFVDANFNTSTKNILASFSFGASGAIQIGTYVNGVSGDVKISPSGILGRNSSGSTTFSIDGTTGAAVFSGTVTAAAGAIGGWTIGATTLSATSGGNTTTLSSGATSFSSGPTATPTVTITQAGVLSCTAAVIDGTSTLGGRLGSTLASAINSSGNFIDANLNTSAKTILSDFSFSPLDYSGAFKTGTITWNTTTGAITGGSGGLFNKGGLIFANAGVATITLDGATGNATFAGTLSAASGTLGSITAGTITGATVRSASSGDRIVFDSTGLYAYDSNNVSHFQLITSGFFQAYQFGASSVSSLIAYSPTNTDATGTALVVDTTPQITDGSTYQITGSAGINILSGNPFVSSSASKTGTGTITITQSPNLSGENWGITAKNYKIEIDGVGNPNTFKWSDDGGSTWVATTVAITGSSQTLTSADGSFITTVFSATTGGVMGDYWTGTVGAIDLSSHSLINLRQEKASNQFGVIVITNASTASGGHDISGNNNNWYTTPAGVVYCKELRSAGDIGGLASTNSLTGTSDLTGNSTGVGTILFKGTTSRDSSGFIKIYIGTTAYYVPVFSAITG